MPLGNGNATAAGQIAYDSGARTVAHRRRNCEYERLGEQELDIGVAERERKPGPGTVTWLKEGTDTDHFTIDATTGVLRMAAQGLRESGRRECRQRIRGNGARRGRQRQREQPLAIVVTVTDAVERIDGQKISNFSGLEVWGEHRIPVNFLSGQEADRRGKVDHERG